MEGSRAYEQAFPSAGADELESLIRARTKREGAERFDDVFETADNRTRGWMIRKALLADGTRPGLPVTSTLRLRRLLAEEMSQVSMGRSRRLARDLLLVGLGRDLAGERWTALARELGVSLTLAHRLYQDHRTAFHEQADYATRATELAHRALT
jgi:hypothetical protein